MKQFGVTSAVQGDGSGGAPSGRRLDQSCQCCTHRVIEIGIGEAVVQLQPRNNPLNEEAALLSRYVVGGGPDGPKLRISEGDHAAMVFGESGRLMAKADERVPCVTVRRDQ
jgi:hypothetical protein